MKKFKKEVWDNPHVWILIINIMLIIAGGNLLYALAYGK